MNNILVTGGAGYIGSVVVEQLFEQGYNVYIIDNLQQGHKEAVLTGATFFQADIRDTQALHKIFMNFKIDAVMHMAADSLAGHSMTDPQLFYQNNVMSGINLLDAMMKFNVKNIIFSSSASIYGESQKTPIDENHPYMPVNVYGETKLIFEKMLHWYGKAYGIKHISLRYFNAAGASERFGEHHNPETHLIPSVLRVALENHTPVTMFGNNYPTRDGSCVRDYVHVIDIAQAHILALNKLDELSGEAFNLGNEEGYSVLEVTDMARRVSGVNIPTVLAPRRNGDPAILVASSQRAKSLLGWKPAYSELDTIIESAWSWMKKHSSGYTQPEKPITLENFRAL